MSVPPYELRGVGKTFGSGAAQVHAVRDVDLTMEEGEFVALVGPSGSGKTTLLQLLGALDHPTRGEVDFEGRDLGELRDAELTRIRVSEIGFVFQLRSLSHDRGQTVVLITHDPEIASGRAARAPDAGRPTRPRRRPRRNEALTRASPCSQGALSARWSGLCIRFPGGTECT